MESYEPQRFWSERLKKFDSLRGVGFASLGKNYNKWMYKARIRNLNEVTEKFKIDWKNSKVLDIGFGNGFFEEYFKSMGVLEVLGLDINTSTIESVQNRFPQYSFITTDIAETRLEKENYFDIATCFAVIYHIVDDDKLLNAIKNVAGALKPGGLFLVSGLILEKGTFQQTCAHYKARTKKELEKVISKAGFEIQYITPISIFLNYPLDWKNPIWRKIISIKWKIIIGILTLTEPTGWLAGAIMYYIDGLLLKFVKTGRATKLLIAKKLFQ
jgi:2-polyprenyl-3-methyl-5-hydroxy-6-metoxy-1,4-benzoquinol methylase